jgi:transketolase
MKNLDEFCINTIRMLSVDMVQEANSGHPGMPMGAAPMAYVLWKRFLRHNPNNPKWPDRDRITLAEEIGLNFTEDVCKHFEVHGWHKYVGREGEIIGIDHFGASAPGKRLLQEFGFTSENILNRVRDLSAREKS